MLTINEEIKHFVRCCVWLCGRLNRSVKATCAFATKARLEPALFQLLIEQSRQTLYPLKLSQSWLRSCDIILYCVLCAFAIYAGLHFEIGFL